VREAEPTLDLGVRQGRLSLERDWLPAVENRGERFFVAFDSAAIEGWLSGEAVARRERQLLNGVEAWSKRHAGSKLLAARGDELRMAQRIFRPSPRRADEVRPGEDPVAEGLLAMGELASVF